MTVPLTWAPREASRSVGTTRAIMLDAVGTTIPLTGAFETALVEALAEVRVDPGPPGSRARRTALYALAGCPTPGMLALYLGDDERARWAHHVFEAAFAAALDRGEAELLPGADEALERLRAAGVRVGVATSLAPPLSDAFAEALGLHTLVDVVLPSAPALRRPPYPDEILTAMLRLGVDAVQQVAVVGDTVGDLVAGTRAGASIVAGVLSGAHDVDDLAAAPHTHLIEDVAALPDVLLA